jgi:hypothetical protein
MAMDNTPPRNRLIALYSALAVITLIALKPAFDAYYDLMVTRTGTSHQNAEGHVAHELNAAEAVRPPLEASVTDAMAGIEHCYIRQIERVEGTEEPEAQGALAYSISPRPEGGVDVQASQAEPAVTDPLMVECVTQRLREMTVNAQGRWRASLVLGFGRTSAIANRHVWANQAGGAEAIATKMRELAQRGRAAFPQIRPEAPAQMDVEPIRGWGQLPQPIPAHVSERLGLAAPAPEVPTEVVPTEVVPTEVVPEAPPEPPAEPVEAPPPPPQPEPEAAPRRPAPAAEEAPPARRRRPPAAEGEEPAARRPRPAAEEPAAEQPAERPRPEPEAERPSVAPNPF